MPRIEPALVPVLGDLARGLRELDVPFGVVGALVPELLLDARPSRMTNDADVAVVMANLDDFESLEDRLAEYGGRIYSASMADRSWMLSSPARSSRSSIASLIRRRSRRPRRQRARTDPGDRRGTGDHLRALSLVSPCSRAETGLGVPGLMGVAQPGDQSDGIPRGHGFDPRQLHQLQQ